MVTLALAIGFKLSRHASVHQSPPFKAQIPGETAEKIFFKRGNINKCDISTVKILWCLFFGGSNNKCFCAARSGFALLAALPQTESASVPQDGSKIG